MGRRHSCCGHRADGRHGFRARGNTVEVFYADRHVVQAGLYFDANVAVTPSIPEPSTWAMMLAVFAGLGFVAFSGRKANVAIV
jgi:PEP-CTERM motif